MAVYQTRSYFLEKYGYLTDNPEIGPALAKHYWHPGNSMTHSDTVMSLTGEDFNARYLANECNLTVKEAWKIAQSKIQAARHRERQPPGSLNATIEIIDGNILLASNKISNEQMCAEFEQYISKAY
jgi:hypothetical protein